MPNLSRISCILSLYDPKRGKRFPIFGMFLIHNVGPFSSQVQDFQEMIFLELGSLSTWVYIPLKNL